MPPDPNPDRQTFARFLVFYAALFAAFGVASPFLPGLLQQHGLGAGELGLVLAAGSAVRLVAGPVGGRLADRATNAGRPARIVLVGFTAAAAFVALLYAPARGLVLLMLVSVVHAAALAPLTPVADSMALQAADGPRPFRYGWVRGAGSAAFIAGALVSGLLVERIGLGVIVWLNAGLLAAAAVAGCGLPGQARQSQAQSTRAPGGAAEGRVSELARVPLFVPLMLATALIGGSHALHDGFEVIRWRSAGLSAAQSSQLWALSVAAEVGMFVVLGPALLRRLGPARALALSAGAGIVRWGTAAQTAWFPAMALVEPLHGLTFALLHLTCMDVIGRTVPSRLAATAQAIYATIAMGAATVLVTLASGPLYGRFGAQAFWAMAGLCALALPLAARLRLPQKAPSGK